MSRYWSIIPAAGIGRRFSAPKQYAPLNGQPLLMQTLSPFVQASWIEGIVILHHPDDPMIDSLPLSEKVMTAQGGVTRADSVLCGLNALKAKASADDWVLVHDAARPCLSKEDLEKLRAELSSDEVGGILAKPAANTLKKVSDGKIIQTIDREPLWEALTPQMFRLGLLCEALEKAQAEGLTVTDEASAVEHMGLLPRIVQGRADNMKVTWPEDLQAIRAPSVPLPRIGHGFDVHRFTEGSHIMLGGVQIPHTHGLEAHSDGDVALHALCDALLGAAALGDIGQHFPDTDEAFKNADSRHLLRQVFAKITAKGYQVANVDLTIVAQAPKLMSYLPDMVSRIAEDLQIHQDQTNLKATTTERLGYIGQKEGIAVHAVALLYKGRE